MTQTTNGVGYRSRRRRRVDPVEFLFGLVLGGGMVTALLLVVALSLGSIWAAIWFLQDIARRLGG